MPGSSQHLACLSTLAFLVALAFPAGAQTFDVDGFVDLRAALPSAQRSWRDGGLGKLEFDGHSPKPFADASVDGRLTIGAGLSALATLRAGPDQKTAIDAIEAYLRYEPVSAGAWRWTSKLGAFFPPISLENEAVGWTSPWTLTPSAINSWVGEELRAIGGETSIEWRYGAGAIALTGAVLGWNDPAGTLLADRGWAFDSRPAGLFGNVRLPDALGVTLHHQGPLTDEPFHEIDDQPGWYAALSWRRDDLGRVTVLRYENRANPALARQGQTAWRTDFTSAGLETDLGDVVILAQAMAGFTEIAPAPAFNSTTDFQSAYLLAGYYFGDFRVAGRVDVFATQENHPGGGPHASEHGHAFTVSGGWKPVRWLLLSAEALNVVSFRAERAIIGLAPAASEFQLQFAARLFF
jgi:hypothetical protein